MLSVVRTASAVSRGNESYNSVALAVVLIIKCVRAAYVSKSLLLKNTGIKFNAWTLCL